MSGNLCRCSAYPNIVDAIREVAGREPRRPQHPRRRTHEDLRLCTRRQPAGGGTRSDERASARFIAGGTNLLDLMKLQIETPEKLVDISRLRSRRRSRTRDDGGLTIGALVPNSDLAADPPRDRAAIRCCRARCWRARRGSCATRRRPAAICSSGRAAIISTTPRRACNKREPGSGCSAIGGFNRILAVLGTSDRLHRDASERHGGGDARARRDDRHAEAPMATGGASRSAISTACPATRRRSRRCSSRAN